MSSTRQTGSDGENRAIEYLLDRGYEIITHNFGVASGEIDIIARTPDGMILFVEVKTVTTMVHGNPAWRISPKKRATIGRIAEIWLREHDLQPVPWRIDAITITPDKIEHFKNCL